MMYSNSKSRIGRKNEKAFTAQWNNLNYLGNLRRGALDIRQNCADELRILFQTLGQLLVAVDECLCPGWSLIAPFRGRLHFGLGLFPGNLQAVLQSALALVVGNCGLLCSGCPAVSVTLDDADEFFSHSLNCGSDLILCRCSLCQHAGNPVQDVCADPREPGFQRA